MAGIDETLMPEIDQTLVPGLDQTIAPGIDQTLVPGIDQTIVPVIDQGFDEHELDEDPNEETGPEDVDDATPPNADIDTTFQNDNVEETLQSDDIEATLQTNVVDPTLQAIEVDTDDVDATHQDDGVDGIPLQQLKRGREDDLTVESGEKKWSGWPGESVFRMLVPAQKVGSIIGRKGEFIKKMVEETKARIKILDGPPGTAERAVMVSAKEEPDSPLPPAMDGLLRIHKRLTDGVESDPSHGPSGIGGKVSTRLLLPASQAGSLIGKNGATVKSIQEGSSCVVRVLGAEDLPLFALQDDRVVEVIGESDNVHQAVELIASHLRKFLVDRSVIPLFEMQMQMPPPQMDHHMPPPHQSWGPPQGPPQNSGRGHGFGGDHQQYMPHQGPPPPRQVENYYPPPEMAPPHMDKHPHQGISAYGREAPMGAHASSNAQPAPSMITQITQQMQIPLAYADAVIGSAGANISYIRRASGATVAIQETRGVPNEMTVEISGTASQVQAAQQLIQNFMADAGAPAPQPQTGGPADQGYNQYAAHGSVYGSPPANNTGHAVPGQGQGGGYGPAYGTNYGY